MREIRGLPEQGDEVEHPVLQEVRDALQTGDMTTKDVEVLATSAMLRDSTDEMNLLEAKQHQKLNLASRLVKRRAKS